MNRYKDPALLADKLKRNSRRVLKLRYKLQHNPDAVRGVYNPKLDKKGNAKLRTTLLQAAKESKMTKEELSSRCLAITRRHV